MRKYIIYVILSGLMFSQSDILYLVDSEGNKKKVVGNFKGIVWEKGEVDFISNDGISYTDPSNILSIKNKNGEELVASKLLEGFRKGKEKKKKEGLCEKNSKINIVMMPVSNDYYGLSELLHNVIDSACFNIKSNMEGLEYLDSKDLLSENLNDFHLNKIGKDYGVDYVSHGYAYTIEVPNKASAPSVASGLAASSIWGSDNLTSFFESLPSAVSHYGNVLNQNKLAQSAGTYLAVTFYLYNVQSGKKEFVYQNTIIKKLG